MKTMFLAAAAGALAALPAAAQDAPQAEFYGGLSGGYHSVGEIDLTGFGATDATDIDGWILGGFVGVRGNVGGGFMVGAEGNYHFGTDVIDGEYGIAATVGTSLGNGSTVFLKAGYQWVDFDVENLAEDAADDLSLSGTDRDDFVDAVVAGVGNQDTDDGFLVGIGTDIAMGENALIRLSADTIEFDTARLTAGVGFRF